MNNKAKRTSYEQTKSEPGIAEAWPANVVERRGEFGWRRVAAVRSRRGIQNRRQMIFDNKCEVKNDPDGPERRTVTMA